MFSYKAFLYGMVVIFCTYHSSDARASSPFCLAGCVEAKIKGLPELADSLEKWATILPMVTQQAGIEARETIHEMDNLVLNTLNEAEKKYGSALDRTNETVNNLIDKLMSDVDAIADKFIVTAQELLREVECTAISTSTRIGETIFGDTPILEKMRFWSSTENVSLEMFDGSSQTIKINKGSSFERADAYYKLLTAKIENASAQQSMRTLLITLFERVDSAYVFNCVKSKALPRGADSHLWRDWERAAYEYQIANSLSIIE